MPDFRSLRRFGLLLWLACAALPAAAQYKVVGPDGRVTYTDRPPSDAAARVSTLGAGGSITEVPAPDTLPLALRQASERYPVTLYTAAECPPCDTARQLLRQRGIPYTEKLVVSDDDALSLERSFGARTVPALTIGAQALRGLSPTEWNAYLDAAGYPRESQLPRGWQPPPAAPLTQRSTARAAAPVAAPAPAPAPAPSRAEPAPGPPTGLRF